MTQHNLTQILKVIRDLVMRNRPCYRDYLGSETATKTMTIGSGVFEDKDGGAGAAFPATDSAFTGFVLGETYTVTIDGVTADYAARNLSPLSEQVGPIIGTATAFNMENGTFDGWIAATVQKGSFTCVAQTLDKSFAGKTISISQVKTETVKRYKTKLLPEYLLPEFLRKNVVASKTEVQSAAAKATDAAGAASTAQTTANAAQTTANAALPKTGGAVSGNLTVDAKNDSYRTVISAGETALQYVNSAGTATDMVVISGRNTPSIVAGEDGSSGFNLSNSGLSLGYTSKNKDGIHLYHANGSSTAGEIVIQHTNLGNDAKERISIASTGRITCNNRLKFDCGSEIEVVQTYGKTGGSAIILRSSTADSTKRFRITVDDTGTLSATEVTE